MKASEVLQTALDTHLPNEDHWWNGAQAEKFDLVPVGRACVIIAIYSAIDTLFPSCTSKERAQVSYLAFRIFWEANDLPVTSNSSPDIIAWNDSPHTTYEDVRLGFKRAIGLAKERGV